LNAIVFGDEARQARRMHAGARAMVAMADCTMQGCSKHGVNVLRDASLKANRVHAWPGCAVGF